MTQAKPKARRERIGDVRKKLALSQAAVGVLGAPGKYFVRAESARRIDPPDFAVDC